MTAIQQALAAIHAAFADPITYTGAGLTDAAITAIFSDEAAEPFPGNGSTARRISFEIERASMPQRPGKGDLIEHATGDWVVNDVTELLAVQAWLVTVEQAA